MLHAIPIENTEFTAAFWAGFLALSCSHRWSFQLL